VGKASRRRQEARQTAPGDRPGKSKLYRKTPQPTIAACEDVLTAYTSGRPPAGTRKTWPTGPRILCSMGHGRGTGNWRYRAAALTSGRVAVS
jgi:hypothetical protein